jgi:hypothetical protein
MKAIIYVISICSLILSGCESESISIYAEKLVGKWRLGETLSVKEFTEDGLAFSYNIDDGRGELFTYFDADESQIRFYKNKDLSGEYHGFPYHIDNDSLGAEHLILTVNDAEGQGYVDCDYSRIE